MKSFKQYSQLLEKIEKQGNEFHVKDSTGEKTLGIHLSLAAAKKQLAAIEISKAKRKKQNEATYQGKKVKLNTPMKGDVKKSKVYVDPDGDGKAKKVNFGDKNMTIKKDIPARRKSFRARHRCDNPGPKDKARYWSCKAW
jgi:hypothetical protein